MNPSDAVDPLDALDQATRNYRKTEKAHTDAKKSTVNAVLAALRAGKRPTDVTDRSPFTAAYVRKLARDNGIEAAPRPRKEPTT